MMYIYQQPQWVHNFLFIYIFCEENHKEKNEIKEGLEKWYGIDEVKD